MAELPDVSLEDAIEAQVLQSEAVLEGLAEKMKATGGSPEGPRFQTQLNIDGKLVDVKDTTPEEKARMAQIAVRERADRAADETKRYAHFKLKQLNEVEAVDAIREVVLGERDIWFDAEREGQNRKAVLEVFGEKAAPNRSNKKESK